MKSVRRASKLWIALSAALLLASASASEAKLVQLLANLTAGEEDPPNTTTGFGVAHFTYDTTTGMLCFAITFTGLSSAEIAAHIHGLGRREIR